MWDKVKARVLEWLPATWKQWVAFAILYAVTIAIRHFLGIELPPPSPPSWGLVAENTYNFGWDEDRDAVKAIAATLPTPVFMDTPAGQIQDPLPDHFYQWEVFRKQDPRGPPAKDQGQVGSCVSFGTNWAVTMTMACDIVMNNANFEFKDIAEEVTYAGSRVQIGKGRLRGSDGSIGAWAASYVNQEGVVARADYPDADLSKYSAIRARQWGDAGAPLNIRNLAKEHPVKGITQIKAWAECKRALAQGYGVAVCSSQGFSMRRDERGVCRPSGSWAHCMAIDGYHVDTNGAEFAHIQNSWGPNAHSGPVGWGNPSSGGFWADASVADRMIKSGGDTWAFSGVAGFPARNPDWFVRLDPAALRRGLFAKQANPFILAP